MVGLIFEFLKKTNAKHTWIYMYLHVSLDHLENPTASSNEPVIPSVTEVAGIVNGKKICSLFEKTSK